MKQFSTVREALLLHPKCPFCRDYLTVKDSESSMLSYSTRKITFPSIGDRVTVDCDTNEVTVTKEKRRTYIGFLYEGVSPVCHSCKKFSYTIQIIIDLKNVKLEAINLNSEKIVVYDSKGTHEVRNVYGLSQS